MGLTYSTGNLLKRDFKTPHRRFRDSRIQRGKKTVESFCILWPSQSPCIADLLIYLLMWSGARSAISLPPSCLKFLWLLHQVYVFSSMMTGSGSYKVLSSLRSEVTKMNTDFSPFRQDSHSCAWDSGLYVVFPSYLPIDSGLLIQSPQLHKTVPCSGSASLHEP